MIPKIIHFCWFGGGPKPEDIVNYIEGWRKLLPDYSFVEWNETKFDIESAPQYVKEAYSVKKYAFVSDYVRIKALHEQGGIYLDTDIEICRRFDELLEGREVVLGFESDRSVETAFLATAPGHKLFGEFLESYQNRRFILEDGSYDMSVINFHFSNLVAKWGIDLDRNEYQTIEEDSIVIYPIDYFAGFDVNNWHVKATENTYTIHHMNASWANSKKKLYFGVIISLQKLLGYDGYDRLKAVLDTVRGRNKKEGSK